MTKKELSPTTYDERVFKYTTVSLFGVYRGPSYKVSVSSSGFRITAFAHLCASKGNISVRKTGHYVCIGTDYKSPLSQIIIVNGRLFDFNLDHLRHCCSQVHEQLRIIDPEAKEFITNMVSDRMMLVRRSIPHNNYKITPMGFLRLKLSELELSRYRENWWVSIIIDTITLTLGSSS